MIVIIIYIIFVFLFMYEVSEYLRKNILFIDMVFIIRLILGYYNCFYMNQWIILFIKFKYWYMKFFLDVNIGWYMCICMCWYDLCVCLLSCY